jgi:mercuric reductase
MRAGDDADLVVIGSGAAAMAAAITARQAGVQVILIESGTVGGTCVNVGCVPSKTLLAAAGARHSALTNPFAGVPSTAGPVDLAALVGQKDELVAELRRAKYTDVAAAHGFEILAGTARFAAADTLTVDGQPLRARAYVTATGAEPYRPALPGLDRVDFLTSATAMEQTRLPDSMVVIGGGYVGAEQAQLFAHLGTRVSLVGRLAPRAEPELAAALRAVFTGDGITVIEEHAVAVEPTVEDGIAVVADSGRRVCAQRLLVATGRRARTDELDLPAAGVKAGGRGFVAVDEAQRTSNPRIYAAGDVTGGPQFVYAAAATGRGAAINALAGETPHPARVDYTGPPSVMFTRPQLASAGLSVAAARAAGYDCACRVLDLAAVPRAQVNLVADAATGRVLGVHALADGAGEMMLAATYAIRAGMTVDDLADTWAPYLTMTESLRLVAATFRTNLPTCCCA